MGVSMLLRISVLLRSFSGSDFDSPGSVLHDYHMIAVYAERVCRGRVGGGALLLSKSLREVK